jgi:gingipain R
MEDFVDWKNSIGVNTGLVDVADIGNDATAIHDFIKSVYGDYNLAYVLLVGDYAQVKSPMSYSSQDPVYTLMDSDNHPDIFVGRFSAELHKEASTQVERTLNYEQAAHDVAMGDWNAKGMGIACDEGLGIGIYGLGDWQHMGLIRDELMLYGFNHVDEIYEPFATKAMITTGIHEGRCMVNYCGHGGPTGWGTTGYNNNDIFKLTNTTALPVINSVACNTGQFHNYYCMGEAWMRHTYNDEPSGGLSFQGSSIGMSWAPPMYGQCNHGVGNQYGYVDNFCMENYETFGGCFYAGMITMMQLAGSSGVNEFEHWHFFGDPSLKIAGAPGLKSLTTDHWIVPTNDPVDRIFSIDLGPDYGGYNYYLIGGASGTDPGTTFPGGLHVPLNLDLFTNILLEYVNGSIFQDFFGTLDTGGSGQAVLSTNGLTPLDRKLHGVHMYFITVLKPPAGAYEEVTNLKMATFVEKYCPL